MPDSLVAAHPALTQMMVLTLIFRIRPKPGGFGGKGYLESNTEKTGGDAWSNPR